MSVAEKDILMEVHKPNGDVERQYPITKLKNIIGLEEITEDFAKVVETVTEKQQKALLLLAANSYIVDEVTGETYKIGAREGKLHFEKSDVSIVDILQTIVDTTEEISKS